MAAAAPTMWFALAIIDTVKRETTRGRKTGPSTKTTLTGQRAGKGYIMTNTEIKNAWNLFKKEAKKEISFDMTGDCYMNKKQIENGTATISLCNDIEYDTDIAHYRATIDRVNAYDSWTADEKKRSEEHNLDMIRRVEYWKNLYGAKVEEAKAKYNEITGSQSFKKLIETIGVHAVEMELVSKWAGLNVYQVRIHY